MDTKKIGIFLKELRKEKGLTQEQLAEKLLVSGRTVSRWETGLNMPDLSILIRISELYDVEIKEILDGERKSEIMNLELKDTLSKVADYNKLEKKKVERAGNIAFGFTFFVCVIAIIIQLMLSANLVIVMGETITLLIGGIAYIVTMVHNGIWDVSICGASNPFKDFLISVVCSGIFTAVIVVSYVQMGATQSQIVLISLIFFIGVAFFGFTLLRLLAYFNKKQKIKDEKSLTAEEVGENVSVNIFVADGNLQADMIVNTLKDNGIVSHKQDIYDAGFAAARYGMGRGVDDRVAIIVPSENADDAMTVIKEMGLN